MKYYAIDFGNSNTNIALLETTETTRKEPVSLSHKTIGFHYNPQYPSFLIPSCIFIDGNRKLIGSEAKQYESDPNKKENYHSNLKNKLKHSNQSEINAIIHICGDFFQKLFEHLKLSFSVNDRIVFTIPAFQDSEERHLYLKNFKKVLETAITNYSELDKQSVIHFCDEALAIAVGYRIFQDEESEQDVLCMDIGSFSADATFFETIDFDSLKSGKTFNTKCNNILYAGTEITKWIHAYATEKNVSCTFDDCETIKISFTEPSVQTTNSKLAELITKDIFIEILEKNDFYDHLADTCISVLPDDLKNNKSLFLIATYFLYTGGTSRLPDFSKSILKKIWSKLFQADQDKFPSRMASNLCKDEFPFEACVHGAAWWLWSKCEKQRIIPISDSDFAIELYQKNDNDKLIAKNVVFLQKGEDISEGIIKEFSIVPANENQDHFLIKVNRFFGSGNSKNIETIKGALGSDAEICLKLKIQNTGNVDVFVDDRLTSFSIW